MTDTEPAKIPHWRDMDWGQFKAHWEKRHVYENMFDKTGEKFPDDDDPLWYAIRALHDRIHSGVGRRGDPMDIPIPTDHVHLAPLPPPDPEIQRQLEELI